MEFLPLILVPVIYFLIAFVKPYIQPKLPFNLCAICVAVSVTWLSLLILWLLSYEVSPLAIGILMGMSVSGIMYKGEAFYKAKTIRNFWFVRLLIVVGGFYAVVSLLAGEWNLFSFILIFVLIVTALVSFLFQRTTHKDVLDEQKKMGKKISLIKRLDDCC